mmetsp:Transcript_10499/g.35097  ORF Transcript_10499/g.35097 Transcript_10499/m.35097 type:complete len:220 (+) Transcript_10499:1913-2572(+)
MVDHWRQDLQETHRDVAAVPGLPLQEEGPRLLHSHTVASPVVEAEANEVLHHLEPLAASDVPILALLDLLEDPRLDERSSSYHAGLNLPALQMLLVVLPGKHVSVADHGDAAGLTDGSALFYVFPICKTGISLLAAPSMNGDCRCAPVGESWDEEMRVPPAGVFVLPDTNLHRHGERSRPGSDGDDLLQPLRLLQQLSTHPLPADPVERTAAVQVEEVG